MKFLTTLFGLLMMVAFFACAQGQQALRKDHTPLPIVTTQAAAAKAISLDLTLTLFGKKLDLDKSELEFSFLYIEVEIEESGSVNEYCYSFDESEKDGGIYSWEYNWDHDPKAKGAVRAWIDFDHEELDAFRPEKAEWDAHALTGLDFLQGDNQVLPTDYKASFELGTALLQPLEYEPAAPDYFELWKDEQPEEGTTLYRHARIRGQARHLSGEPLNGAVGGCYIYKEDAETNYRLEAMFFPFDDEGKIDIWNRQVSEIQKDLWADRISSDFFGIYQGGDEVGESAASFVWSAVPLEEILMESTSMVNWSYGAYYPPYDFGAGCKLRDLEEKVGEYHFDDIVFESPMVEIRLRFDLGDRYVWSDGSDEGPVDDQGRELLKVIDIEKELLEDPETPHHFYECELSGARQVSFYGMKGRIGGRSDTTVVKRTLLSAGDWRAEWSVDIDRVGNRRSLQFGAKPQKYHFEKGKFHVLEVTLSPLERLPIAVKDEEGNALEDVEIKESRLAYLMSEDDAEYSILRSQPFGEGQIITLVCEGYHPMPIAWDGRGFPDKVILREDKSQTGEKSDKPILWVGSGFVVSDKAYPARLVLRLGSIQEDQTTLWADETFRVPMLTEAASDDSIGIPLPSRDQAYRLRLEFISIKEASRFGYQNTTIWNSENEAIDIKEWISIPKLELFATEGKATKGLVVKVDGMPVGYRLPHRGTVRTFDNDEELSLAELQDVRIGDELIDPMAIRTGEMLLESNLRIDLGSAAWAVQKVEVTHRDSGTTFIHKSDQFERILKSYCPDGSADIKIEVCGLQGRDLAEIRGSCEVGPTKANKWAIPRALAYIESPSYWDISVHTSISKSPGVEEIDIEGGVFVEAGEWWLSTLDVFGLQRREKITLHEGQHRIEAFAAPSLKELSGRLRLPLPLDPEKERLLSCSLDYEYKGQSYSLRGPDLVEDALDGEDYVVDHLPLDIELTLTIRLLYEVKDFMQMEREYVIEGVVLKEGEEYQIEASRLKEVCDIALPSNQQSVQEYTHYRTSIRDQKGKEVPWYGLKVGEEYTLIVSAYGYRRQALPDLHLPFSAKDGFEWSSAEQKRFDDWMWKLEALAYGD